MANPQTLCRTITLTDEPEQNDAFSGPHQRIADAIAGLIQPPDAKGISIGVEGSWGSGKSTVARLLTTKLESDKNIAVVTFDAWAHEGDPLRRTFLETIIRKLQQLRWVNRKYWKNRIEELANRREVVTTKDKLKITQSGKAIAFMLLLVPIGSAFINAALRENVTVSTWPPGFKFTVLISIGLVLTFTPLFVMLWKIKNEPDILGVLFNKGPTEKTTETSKTVNPTSIEFENNFRKLFKHALGRPKNKQKRIVLILDNLDRVDAQDALSIWSTLQTFLQHKGTSRPSWHERVWLLVLYDLGGLSQLWENSDNQNDAKTAVSFIDKSFQVRFEVPALVRSDWRKYLMDQLTEAFPDHTQPGHTPPEFHDVYRVLNTWAAEKNKVLTIRELKLFVNQIGSVHRQWAGTNPTTDPFPLALIAYYVLLRRDGVDVVMSLFNSEFPAKDYQELLGNNVREGLAALAFNVEVDVAQQLLFSGKINNALTLGSHVELESVASLLRRGFWEVFEQVAREWASSETLKIADAALAIEKSGILNTGGPAVRSVKKYFCDRAATANAWSPIDPTRAEGIATLFKWKQELPGTVEQYDQFTQALFKSIALGLLHVDQKLSAKEWLDHLKFIVNDLEFTTKEKSLATVVETLSSRLGELDVSYPYPSELIFEVLCELQERPEISTAAEKELTELADTGLMVAKSRQLSRQSSSAGAWIVYITIRYSSSLKDSPLVRTDSAEVFSNPSMFPLFVPILQRFNQTSRLFEISRIAPDLMPLVSGSLRIALNSSDAAELFNTEDALERLEFIFKELVPGEEEESVLATLISARSTQLVKEIMHGEFQPLNAHLYLFLLKIPSGEKKPFASWCVSGLHSVQSYDEYAIWGANSLVDLALYLTGTGEQVYLGEIYLHQLKENLESRIPEQAVRRSADENLAALIGPLESPLRREFQEYLGERISRNETPMPSYYFKVFQSELKTQLLHSSNGAQVVELLPNILTKHYKIGLQWLKNTLIEAGESLKSKYSKEPAWTKFKQAVRWALISERSNDENYPLVKEIANLLAIKLPRNGLIAFATADQSSISTLNPENLETEILITEPFLGVNSVSDPSWSPDGKKLAYIGASASSGGAEILIFDAFMGGSDPVRGISKKPGHPTWSPDGQTLAFQSEGEISGDIFTIDLETHQERRLTKEFDTSERPTWSPDGTRLAFHRILADTVGIFLMNPDGSNPTAITTGSRDSDPSWSPDGKQIAFARWAQTPSEKNGIYLIDPYGDWLAQLIEEKDARAPTWSPDGTKLLFQVGHGSEARIYQIDADGQNKKELTKGMSPSWQPILDDGPEELSESPAESTATVDSAT